MEKLEATVLSCCYSELASPGKFKTFLCIVNHNILFLVSCRVKSLYGVTVRMTFVVVCENFELIVFC